MNRRVNSKKMLATTLVFALILASWNITVSNAKTGSQIKLNKTKVALEVKDTVKLTVKNVSKKDISRIKWTTSNAKVATVTANKKKKSVATVKAVKKGTAKITASLSGKKAACKVTVKDKADNSSTNEGNATYQSDVTWAMTKYTYWAKLQKDADKVLLDEAAIRAKNQKILADKACNMYDLRNMSMEYNTTAEARRDQLADATIDDMTEKIGSRTSICVGGELYDKEAIDKWFLELKKNITDADVSGLTRKQYAICTKRADLWMAPNDKPVGWSETDPDDEFQNGAINVNEPFIVDMVSADGKFYHGCTNFCPGWVKADSFAICNDKDTWLAQWDLTGDQVLVVTTSHITLELSNMDPDISGVHLMLGTQLPLVPQNQIPKNISERGTWYNYVVWLPTRDKDGRFVRRAALISMHHDVSIGFPKLTEKNLLKVAFSCLGDRYGWGGMLHAMDCSLYTRAIYRCFGFDLPRNTTWQSSIPSYKVDLASMTDKEKKNAISKLPVGTLLLIARHIMMYIGEVNGKQYVISDTGTLSETEDSIGKDVSVMSQYCVAINSLNVRRKNGNTWLAEMLTGIVPWKD